MDGTQTVDISLSIWKKVFINIKMVQTDLFPLFKNRKYHLGIDKCHTNTNNIISLCVCGSL